MTQQLIQFKKGLIMSAESVRTITPTFSIARTRTLVTDVSVDSPSVRLEISTQVDAIVEWTLDYQLIDAEPVELMVGTTKIPLASSSENLLDYIKAKASRLKLDEKALGMIEKFVEKIGAYHAQLLDGGDSLSLDSPLGTDNTSVQMQLDHRIKRLNEMVSEDLAIVGTTVSDPIEDLEDLQKALARSGVQVEDGSIHELLDPPFSIVA